MSIRTRPRIIFLWACTFAVSAAAAAAVPELLVRVLKIRPRIQVVRQNLTLVDGVPTWAEAAGTKKLRNEACAARLDPDASRIAIFGDSILFGSGIDAEDVFSVKLQRRLDELQRVPGFCVMNFSEPGFTFEAKFALANQYVRRYKPKLVYWGIWLNEPHAYAIIGNAAYSFRNLRLGRDGYPRAFPVPPAFNRWLFTHSRAYELATLAQTPLGSEDLGEVWRDYVRDKLPRLIHLARRSGAKLVLVFCPPLDRPFSASLADSGSFSPVLEFAKKQGIAAIRLESELAGQDYLRLRLNDCCHYNAQGHTALAQMFYRRTLEFMGLEH